MCLCVFLICYVVVFFKRRLFSVLYVYERFFEDVLEEVMCQGEKGLRLEVLLVGHSVIHEYLLFVGCQ